MPPLASTGVYASGSQLPPTPTRRVVKRVVIAPDTGPRTIPVPDGGASHTSCDSVYLTDEEILNMAMDDIGNLFGLEVSVHLSGM